MSGIYAVFREFGAGWIAGAALEDQPLWQPHVDFMDDLTARNVLLMAGPLEGLDQALVVVRAGSAEQAMALLAKDPWSVEVLTLVSAHRWHIRLGTFETGEAT